MTKRPKPQDIAWANAITSIREGDNEKLKKLLDIHFYIFEDSDFRHPPCNILARRNQLVAFAKDNKYDEEIATQAWYSMLIPEKREELGV